MATSLAKAAASDGNFLSNMRGASNKDSYSSYDPLYTMYDIDTIDYDVIKYYFTEEFIKEYFETIQCKSLN